METNKNQNKDSLPLNALPPLPLELFILQTGISPATCKRYRRLGFLKTFVIGKKPYVTREALAEFNERAARGDFDERNQTAVSGGEPEVAGVSTCLIEPAGNDCQTIEAFLIALLGGDGAERLCCWLKVAYEALRAGVQRKGQALIIVGPADFGKSWIQHQIITPILGGRSADPTLFFLGRTEFNAEMVGSEHLLIEDVPSSSRHEKRLKFGERIKEVVASDTTRLHKKNHDAVTVSPLWRLPITINDDPEKLRCLPPLTDDLAEKIIMLQAGPAPEFWERFADAPDPRKAFRDSIAEELPAFVKKLIDLPIPERLQARRYWIASHIPDELGFLRKEPAATTH